MNDETLVNNISSGLNFEELLNRMLLQNGYSSDNSKKGLKSTVKDYVAVFRTEPPEWISLIWPSTAVSVVHLSLSFKKKLPEKLDLPEVSLKS